MKKIAFQNKINKKNQAFTLIELLVVIAIIGLLAMIVLVSLNSARVRARDARRLSDLHQMSLAMEMYYDLNSSAYPLGVGFSGAAGTYVTLLQGTTPPLIGATPVDPSNSGSNIYTALPGGTTSRYCFYTQLQQVATQYAVASEAGAGKRTPAPAAQGACGPNI